MADTSELEPELAQLVAARPDDDDALVEAMVAGRLFGRAHAAKLGRFTLIERLGRGGMGDVYAAYDPVLDRKVALKLLRTDSGVRRLDADERGWLVREARAAARLAHPNVVAIHEVGELGEGADGIYVAMEYIEGQTLRVWLREGRKQAAILEVFVQAGLGLAAAHAAGVIHRDFKPENVLVCGEGSELRVRVVDFGLARVAERMQGEGSPSPPSAIQTTPMGTPAYMSPEQLRGESIDARSDQFGFCVALHEALTGQHPFGAGLPGATLETILARIAAGERPIAERSLPGWLRKILRRGLALDPADRYPSMRAVVALLRATPARRRRRLSIAAAALLALGSSALTVASLDAPPTPSCTGAGAELRGVWDASTRAAARQAFADSKLANAAEVWERIEPRLDEYASAWIASRELGCRARLAGDGESLEAVELRDACLDRRRAELRGLTELLRDPTPTVILAAIATVDQLTPIRACSDIETLRREASLDETLADPDQVERLRQEILRRSSQARMGQALELASPAEQLVREAEALAAPTALAEALVLRSLVEEGQGDYDVAAASLEAPLLEAVAARHDRLHAEIATRLVWLHGVRRQEPVAATAWVARADAAIRSVRRDPLLRARLLDYRSSIASVAFDPASAERLQREAIAIRREFAPDSDVELAPSLGNLGRILVEQGEPDQAAPLIEESLARYRKAFGPHHPDVAAMESNLGQAYVDGGELERGRALLEHALALKERIYGPAHIELLNTLNNLGNATPDPETARGMFERGLAIAEREFGPQSSQVANLVYSLAFIAWLHGDADATLRHAERALAIQALVYGEDHPTLALTHELLARGQLDAGEPEAAAATIERALELARAGQLKPIERGNLLLSAAWIAKANAAPASEVRALADDARMLLGEDPGPDVARELAELLGP